jgi:hypothetical protein
MPDPAERIDDMADMAAEAPEARKAAHARQAVADAEPASQRRAQVAETPAAATEVAAAQRTVVRSQSPTIYVPRRLRVGGLPGIRHGAAIVGTPQGGGVVAIDVQATGYVDLTPEIWGAWVAEAAEMHSNAALEQELAETMLVSEHDLVEIGHFKDDCVLVDEVGRARLSMWIEAGRTAYMADE